MMKYTTTQPEQYHSLLIIIRWSDKNRINIWKAKENKETRSEYFKDIDAEDADDDIADTNTTTHVGSHPYPLDVLMSF